MEFTRRQNSTATCDKIEECTNPANALLLQALIIKRREEEALLALEKRRDGDGVGEIVVLVRNYIHFNPLKKPPLPFYDLRPEDRVEVADLAASPNQVLWGKYLLCQTVMTAVGNGMDLEVPVTDPKGTLVARLSLHNYYFVEKCLLEVDFDDILPPGSFVVVQNPWFKTTEEGAFILYAENPAEVQLISKKKLETKFQGLEWNDEFAKINIQVFKRRLFWDKFEDEEAAFVELKGLGNIAHWNRWNDRFSDAIRFYDMALDYCAKNGEDEAMIQSKKSGALLGLGCFAAALKCADAALKCADAALEMDPENERHIYRKTKALIGLGKYEEGLNFLGAKIDQLSYFKDSKHCQDLLEAIKSLAERKNVGPTKSQLLSIRLGTLSKDDVIPEFKGPFAISSEIEEGKGRGLIATEDIRPGQLVIATRAFAYQAMTPGLERSTYTSINPLFENLTQEQVVRQIANKLVFESELGPELYSLTAGGDQGHLESGDEKSRHVDMKRIMEIVKMNSWSSGEDVAEEQYTGLWIVPSFLNHSCSEYNCIVNICGEWMTVRAIFEIKKGEELTLPYKSPILSFDKRCRFFESRGFTCSCQLCELEANEPASVKNERRKILNTLGQLSSDSGPSEIRKGVRLVEKLVSLRADNFSLNFPLLSPQIFKLVEILEEKGRIGDALSMLNPMFEVAAVSVCWHKEGVDVAMSLLTKHAQRGDKEVTKVWMDTVKELLMKFDGNLEAMRIKGAGAVKLLKEKFGIDFFADEWILYLMK